MRGTRPISPSRISIHAPRVGRDRGHRTRWSRPSIFQSTRPVWGATAIRGARARAEAISIHAPRVGRDKGRGENLVVTLDISIHAPRVGRDCGRHHTDDRAKRFQSTRPVWGATWDQITDMAAAVFQSTRPVWGATVSVTCCERAVSYFNPRAPCGARHQHLQLRALWHHFNPRAPCGARPSGGGPPGPCGAYFNPRAPCGARLPAHRPVLFAP